MKIVEMQSENVKRIRAVSIKPDGSMVTISGENGQGKSSVLDSIAYALGGKELHPPEVIRRGEESATVVIDLGDIVVRRRWTAGGTSLTVENKEGTPQKSPQAMLDKLVGSLSFDPLAFLKFDRQKQGDTFRDLMKIDTSAIDSAHDALFAKRTTINTQGKDLLSRFESMPAPAADVPSAEVSVTELLDEQSKLQAVKQANDLVRSGAQRTADAYDVANNQVPIADKEVERLEQELTQAKVRLSHARSAASVLQQRKLEAADQVAKLVDPDVSEVYRRIRTAESTNVAVRAKLERAKVEQLLQAKRADKKKLTDELEKLESDKRKLFRDAKFPVPGLAFTTEGLTLNELPFEQASSAEQLRVAVAMGLALNPTLKVILIRDGSLLDKKSLAMVAEMAAAADAQVWLEKVGAGDVGIVIEDGQLLDVPAAKSAA